MKQIDPETKVLIEGVMEQDESAAKALVERLYPLVLKIARRHRPRRTQEEDLTQIIFTTIFTKIHQYSGKAPLEHWVSRVAVNTCLNQLKAEKVRPELRWADLSEEECAVIESFHRTDENVHPVKAMAAREVLNRLLERLKPKDRLLVELMYVEERSTKEIQEQTGWSEPVIKVRAFRARQKLQKIWKEIKWQEDNEVYRSSIESAVKSGLASA
jgi:RNA polymerase sigma-70 factor (ECF subfamily)